MMHSNSFVLAVKDSSRRILREVGGRVFLPFNSEYSLLLKNMHDVRAICTVSIDGTDVIGGEGLVIPAFGNVDLERFLVDGDMNKGSRFRFVRKSDSRVQDPSNPDNGIIEVHFWKEMKPTIIYYKEQDPQPWVPPVIPKWPPYPYSPMFSQHLCQSSFSATPNIGQLGSVNCMYSQQADMSASNGATVEGSLSKQAFVSTSFAGKDGSATVLRLTLMGCDKPVTVNETKHIFCGRCGKRNAFRNIYCGKCGLKLNKEEFMNA